MGDASRSYRLPPRRARLALLVVALLVSGAAPGLASDAVVLTSGTRLEGRVVSETPEAVVFEPPGGRSRLTIPRAQVARVERDLEPKTAAPDTAAAGEPAAARDEWWLLKSGERVVGVRHLLVVATERAAAEARTGRTRRGFRLEEHLTFLGSERLPSVRVERIEETTDEFQPVYLHYGERGAGAADRSAVAYDVFRAGPVVEGVWSVTVREGTRSRAARVEAPAGARGPLGLREALVRATPRTTGLVEMALLDPHRGLRTVRAGFTSLDVGGGGARIDVLRVEDGDRALTSRWAPGDPPECLVEDVAPGVVAVPATRAQAAAALPADAAPLDVRDLLRPTKPAASKPTGPRRVLLPDVGVELTLPADAWEAEVVPPQGDDVGARVVARLASRLDATDARVEWDPAGGGADPAEAERALLERLRRVARDLRVETPRSTSHDGVSRLRVVATVRRETLTTWVLFADRGAGLVTILVAAPAAAVGDVAPAVEALLASFRRL